VLVAAPPTPKGLRNTKHDPITHLDSWG